MKKTMTLILTMLLAAALLSACGQTGKTESKSVDLGAFYDGLVEAYEWEDPYMTEITGDMLESYYPGLLDIPTKQMVARMPMMSAVVNEMVFLECESEDDAAKAAAILQERIDAQAEGGAWYPESMEAWKNGAVIQQGTYVAMIASAEHQDEIEESFTGAFA